MIWIVTVGENESWILKWLYFSENVFVEKWNKMIFKEIQKGFKLWPLGPDIFTTWNSDLNSLSGGDFEPPGAVGRLRVARREPGARQRSAGVEELAAAAAALRGAGVREVVPARVGGRGCRQPEPEAGAAREDGRRDVVAAELAKQRCWATVAIADLEQQLDIESSRNESCMSYMGYRARNEKRQELLGYGALMVVYYLTVS